MNEFEYNVLWIEDDSADMQQMISFFSNKGVRLCVYPTILEGKAALEQSPNYWDAILLDGEVPNGENEVPDLSNTIRLVMEMQNRSNLPLFIFSGKDNVVNNSAFQTMVASAKAKIYRKSSKINVDGNEVDVERVLRADMINAMDSREDRVIKMNYPELFRNLSEIEELSEKKYFETEVLDIVLPILRAMHNPDKHPDFEPRDKYNGLRQLVELVYRKLNDFGIVPDCCIKDGKVNLNQCHRYLIGEIAYICHVFRDPITEPVLPCYINNILFNVLSLGNSYSHSNDVGENEELSNERLEEIAQILSNRDSRFLIFGSTLEMIEVFRWLIQYIKQNSNVAENRLKAVYTSGEVKFDSERRVLYLNDDVQISGQICEGDYFEVPKGNGRCIYLNNNSMTNNKYKYFIRVY